LDFSVFLVRGGTHRQRDEEQEDYCKQERLSYEPQPV